MTAAATATALGTHRLNAQPGFTSKRPPEKQRKFRSKAVDAAIDSTSAKLRDPELAWLFSNCLPNTLDTTVVHGTFEGHPDTMVITGDIPAMWLRDSSAQVWPYLQFVSQDSDLARMIEGLIRRQTRCILVDPYANAFMPDLTSREPLEWSVHDHTDMKPGVGERKWEVDSLCYPVRLACATGKRRATPRRSISAGLRPCTRSSRRSAYSSGNRPRSLLFQRSSSSPNDTLNNSGYGNPAGQRASFIPASARLTTPASIR